MGIGEAVAVGLILVWCVAFLYFAGADIIKGIRSKKMAGYSIHGNSGGAGQNTYPTSMNGQQNMMADTIHSANALKLNGHGLVWNKPDGNNVDIAKAAEIFWFFLTQHPEIVEQFDAIERIKKS